MAAIRISFSQIAVISKRDIRVYHYGKTDCQIYTTEKPELKNVDGKGKPQGNEEGSDKILASGYSTSGQHFAACDDYKQLTIWKVNTDGSWCHLNTRSVARRVTSLTYAADDSAVLIADKSGDVFRFSVTCADRAGELLLGHVSMLLDLVLIPNDSVLVTCDRDEKIRFSHYPNCYSIRSYCLGHTDFVSRLLYLEQENVIISGSGDGTVRVWDVASSSQLCLADCKQDLTIKLPDTEKCTDLVSNKPHDSIQQPELCLKCLSSYRQNQLLAVGFEGLPVVLIYKYCVRPWTLSIVQEIVLSAPLGDATLDNAGNLWLLQAKQGDILNVYKQSDEHKFKPVTDLTESCFVTASVVNKTCPHSDKDSLEGDSIFSILHKVKIDNFTFYQERKQQKLEEQKQRYKNKAERRKQANAAKMLPPGESDEHSPNVAPISEQPEQKRIKIVTGDSQFK